MSKVEYVLIFILIVIIGLVLWALFGTWLQELVQSFINNLMQ